MAVPVPPAPPGGPYPASYPGRNFAFDAGKIGESKENYYGNPGLKPCNSIGAFRLRFPRNSILGCVNPS